MKKLLAGGAAAALLPAAAWAQSDEGGGYLQIHIGPAVAVELDLPTFAGDQFAADTDSGGAVGFIGGYRTQSGVGFEIEAGNRAHGVESGGDFALAFFMANMTYEFSSEGRWRPYVAGGVGVAGSDNFDFEDTSLAGQVKAGLRYKFGATQSVGLEATYLGAHDLGNDFFPIDYGGASLSLAYRIGLGGR